MALSLDLQLKNLASGETSHVALPSGLFAFFSGWLSNRGIQLRSGRPRVSISPAFESLDDPRRRDLQLPLQNWPLNSTKSPQQNAGQQRSGRGLLEQPLREQIFHRLAIVSNSKRTT